MHRVEPPNEEALKALIHAAAMHHSAGRFGHAEACYRQIITVMPTWAEAFNNLGCVLLDRGNDPAAIECYRHAITLEPANAQAHFNLGFALRKGGQADAAAICFLQAVKLDPRHMAALNALGVIHLDQGRLKVAENHFRRVLSIDSLYADAHNNLGNVLKAMQRFNEAEGCYRSAIAAKPYSTDYLNNLGLALEDQGRLDEAADVFRKAITSNPRCAQPLYNLSQVKRFTEKDADFQALEHAAGQADLFDISLRPLVHFALARAYDDLAEYQHAFPQFSKGNQQKRRLVEYDPLDTEQKVDLIIKSIDASPHRPIGGVPSDVPIFIVGMPRSGSTLVEQILSSHPQIQGGGELTLLSRVVSGGRDPTGKPMSYSHFIARAFADDSVLQHLGRLYLDGLPALQPGKRRLTDKMPANFFHLGLIHRMLPDAQIIHSVRDPVDTCFSCFSTLFSTGMLYSYDLHELGRYYRAYSKLMDHWRSVLPTGVMLDVPYELLVAEPEKLTRQVIAHCRLPWDESCLRYTANPRPVGTASRHQVRRPIYADSVGRARRYTAYLQPLIDALKE